MGELVTCTECKWVSFAVTRAYAMAEVKAFNKYYKALKPKTQKLFGGPAKLSSYVCQVCGGSSFTPAEPSNKLFGVTLNPVIYEG